MKMIIPTRANKKKLKIQLKTKKSSLLLKKVKNNKNLKVV